MTKDELNDALHNGESSGVEFKLDDVENHKLARDIVAFANFAGGVVLLGVGDDGVIQGVHRPRLEEWLMETCRTKVDPPIIPYFEWIRDAEPGKDIAVVRVLTGPDKPYALAHARRRTYYIRVGTTSREASRDELQRMFQGSGRFRYGVKPVPGAQLGDLDHARLRDYLGRVLGLATPPDGEAWTRLLINLDLLVADSGLLTPTVDGLLLFGARPRRLLPQAGIRAIAYTGEREDYAARADQQLDAPLVRRGTEGQGLLAIGLVEEALDFVNRNTQPTARIERGVRVDRPAYPAEVVREVIVNALVHRDYGIHGVDVLVAIFSNRLEIKSPGRLPNTATVEALKVGFRYARNQTLVNVMRDYRYVDARGMGIREKVIPGMRAHNNTDVDLIETEWDFTVRLWGDAPAP